VKKEVTPKREASKDRDTDNNTQQKKGHKINNCTVKSEMNYQLGKLRM